MCSSSRGLRPESTGDGWLMPAILCRRMMSSAEPFNFSRHPSLSSSKRNSGGVILDEFLSVLITDLETRQTEPLHPFNRRKRSILDPVRAGKPSPESRVSHSWYSLELTHHHQRQLDLVSIDSGVSRHQLCPFGHREILPTPTVSPIQALEHHPC